ncbi:MULTISPECIES: ATP-binding cassette domain-containing protein [unclassified Streptomyces]|uniref:ATP-binding cassette domain-containing protein n=1 Tax=unclassified Streptomyces TaxID=2593676 RepID=UPI002E819B14|nr:ATP-binding cassette domain-containing protein [Streptomyces sp. NBC_00569]
MDRLTLDIPAGEFAVLVGPSDCGKTTTTKLINRLTGPRRDGSIWTARTSRTLTRTSSAALSGRPG